MALLTFPFYATGLHVVGDVIFVAILLGTSGSVLGAARHLRGVREQLDLRRRHGWLRFDAVYMYAIFASMVRPYRSA